MKKKSKRIPIGSKANFTKKVKGGATVRLYSDKNYSGISEYRKSYKTKSGKRRVLQIVTYKKVIK